MTAVNQNSKAEKYIKNIQLDEIQKLRLTD